MLFALAAKKVGLLFGDVGALAVAAGHFNRQCGEVRTFYVVVEVGGGEEQATVRRFHHRTLIVARGRARVLMAFRLGRLRIRWIRSYYAVRARDWWWISEPPPIIRLAPRHRQFKRITTYPSHCRLTLYAATSY